MRRCLRTPSLLLLVLVAASCSARVAPPVGGPGAPLAPAAVERFLQLAAERDFVQMGWIFGTAQGPALSQHPVGEVEKRMYAIAHVLQHDGFVVGPERAVPGRMGAAMRYEVMLTREQRTYRVPFTVVRGPNNRWFVELVDVEAVTNVR